MITNVECKIHNWSVRDLGHRRECLNCGVVEYQKFKKDDWVIEFNPFIKFWCGHHKDVDLEGINLGEAMIGSVCMGEFDYVFKTVNNIINKQNESKINNN